MVASQQAVDGVDWGVVGLSGLVLGVALAGALLALGKLRGVRHCGSAWQCCGSAAVAQRQWLLVVQLQYSGSTMVGQWQYRRLLHMAVWLVGVLRPLIDWVAARRRQCGSEMLRRGGGAALCLTVRRLVRRYCTVWGMGVSYFGMCVVWLCNAVCGVRQLRGWVGGCATHMLLHSGSAVAVQWLDRGSTTAARWQ